MKGILIKWGHIKYRGSSAHPHPNLGILIRERGNLLIPLSVNPKTSSAVEVNNVQENFSEEYWKRSNDTFEFIGDVEVPEDLVLTAQNLVTAKEEFFLRLSAFDRTRVKGEVELIQKGKF